MQDQNRQIKEAFVDAVNIRAASTPGLFKQQLQFSIRQGAPFLASHKKGRFRQPDITCHRTGKCANDRRLP